MEKHSLKKIIGLLKDRKISEKELLQHYFSRINKFNPSLNALVSLRSIDEVLNDLENLKRCSMHKKTKSLFGIPLAVKDLIDVKGLPTTYGVPKYKNNVAKKNSIIVDRLIDSGALIIGKTNTPEWGLGSRTHLIELLALPPILMMCQKLPVVPAVVQQPLSLLI